MPISEGLYKVTFQTPLGAGYGVLVFAGGRLQGGDSMMYYVGSYQEQGNRFSADVTVNQHSSVQGMESVLGVSQATIRIEGNSSGDNVVADGTSPQAPGVPFQAILSRLA
jgi:hypothetical protein